MMNLISVSHSFNVDAKIQKNFQTSKFYALQSLVFSFFLRKNMPFDFPFITHHFSLGDYILFDLNGCRDATCRVIGFRFPLQSLGFLSPINYALELVRFRNVVEKESGTLRGVEWPLLERSGERTRHVASLHFWGKFYIVSSLYDLWILFIGREVRREVGREVSCEVIREVNACLSRWYTMA